MELYRLLLLALVNSIFYYSFFYYALYSIKKSVNLYYAAFILFILFSFALMTCPIVLDVIGLVTLQSHLQFLFN